jgi:hypothetical protein
MPWFFASAEMTGSRKRYIYYNDPPVKLKTIPLKKILMKLKPKMRIAPLPYYRTQSEILFNTQIDGLRKIKPR